MSFDVEEYAKQRKKNSTNNNEDNENTSTFDVEDYVKQRNLPQVGEYLTSSVNSWLQKNNSFFTTYNERIGRYQDKDALDWEYEADSADWLSALTTQRDDLNKEAKAILSLVNEYGSYLGEDYISAINKAIYGNLSQYGNIVTKATEINDHWSNFETEDVYNEWVAQERDKQEKLSFNLVEGKAEIDRLQGYANMWDEATQAIPALKISISQLENEAKFSTNAARRAEAQKKLEADKQSLARYESIINQLDGAKVKSDLSEKMAYYTLAERAQKAKELASVADVNSENYDPAFEKYAAQGEEFGKDPEKWWQNAENIIANRRNDPEFIEAFEKSAENSNTIVKNTALDQITYKAAKYMTEEEFKLYNYYFAKDKENGTNLAEEYLESIEETLNYKQASGIALEYEDKSTLAKIIFAGEVGLDQFGSGIEGWFSDGYTPASAVQMAGGMIREDLAGDDDGFKIFGSSLGQVGYDIVSTTANMLPSILASTAINVVAPGAGAVVGAGLMGASAGGNAKVEMLNLGYSKEQANAYGIMVGVAEAGMEYLLGGISKLGGKASGGLTEMILSKVDNAFARTAIKIGGSMLSEGFEEGVQTVIEPWLKEIATGVDWEAPNIDEILYSSLLGALSAFGLEGAGVVAEEVSTYKSGKKIQKIDGGVEKLQKLGQTFSADTVAYKIAGKVNAQTDAYTIGRLLNEVGATISEQNLTEIANGLTNRGMSSNTATKIAKQYQAFLNNEMRMTDAQVKILENLSPLADVLRTNIIGSNTTVYQRTRAYSDLMSLANEVSNRKKGDVSKAEATEKTTSPISIFEQNDANAEMQRIASEVASGKRESASDRFVRQKVEETKAFADSSAEARLGVEGRYTYSDTGATRLKSNKQKVNIVGVDSIAKDGTMTLKLADGSIVSADDISFRSSNEAIVYEAVAKMGVSANTAWEIIKGYDPKSNQSGTMYAMGALEAYTYGHNGVKVNEMSKNGFADLLSPVQKNTANRLGDIDAKAKVEAQQKSIDKAVRDVRIEAKSKHKPIEKRKGGVVLEGVTSTLTDLQDKQIDVLGKMAEGLGVTFHIFESKEDAEGKRYYTMSNGKTTSANGWYDPKTGEIWIDLHAGNNYKGTMLFTAAHELTHFIRQWSPAKFKIFADFLMEQYGKKGQDVNQLVRNQITKAANNGRSISWDEAYEEVIADSCETFLRDSKAAEKIAALREKDAGLANKIKTFLGQMLAKIRKFMADAKLLPDTDEGKMVAEMTDSLQKLYDLWTDALADAGTAYSTLANIDLNTESVAPMLSERTWTASEYVTEREETAKKIAKALDVDIKTAYKYIDDINSVARLIADDRARLDYEPNLDEHATVLKPNSDYKYSVDMSTLCAKRLLFTGTFDAIQRALPNTVFDSEDIVALREMMQQRGYEVACGICYVESTRREIGRITQEFIDRYKEAQKTGKPITRINSEGKAVDLKKTKDQMETTADKSADKFYADKDYTPTLADLNTTDIDIVKRDHPLVYEAYLNFMNARGQAKPKLLETRAEYKGEILKHFKYKSAVTARNNAGGLRLQSFSDFEVPHLIDMMQIVMDMSRVGLKSQAYTKVPAFAEIFGDTGVKINLSLIAKGDGLDANGNLVFDDVEGINHKEAFKLRDKYSKNVGTILVGKTDAHIIAAMADSRIDYIIPFHKSSWKESLYDALGLTGYADYTDYQNEKPIDKGREIKNFDPSEYWDFSKSGDENAQIYLAKCREDGRIPKFPQFQGYPGYWKLLIDFKMYDNDGVGSPQEVVRPEFNTEASERILSEYKGGHKSFPVARDVVEDFVKEHQEKVKYSDRDSDGNTLSKEQQEFFKDSKARDENGNLIVLYHGTAVFDNITEFRTRAYNANRAVGLWLSDSHHLGALFASYMGDDYTDRNMETAEDADIGLQKKGGVYKLYANLTNPLVVDALVTTEENLGGTVFKNYKQPFYYEIPTPEEMKAAGEKATTVSGEEIATFARANGYDGVIIKNVKEGYGTAVTDVIAFEPNQVKYVDNRTPTSNPDIRYSFRGTNKDGLEVYETSDDVLKLPWKERKNRYLSYIEEIYVGRTAKFVRNGHVYYAEFDRKNAKKAVYGDKRSDNAGRDALINTGADGSVFELIENANYDGSGRDKKNHTSTDYFDYFIKTVQIDNKVFDLLADVRKQYYKDGGFVYTIRLVENKKIKASPIQGGQAPLVNSGNTLIADDIITQPDGFVKSESEKNLYSDRVLMGSLFSGGGTLEAGLVYQMLDKEFAVEYNKKIAATYTDNHGKEHMFVGDVRDFNSKDKQDVFYLHASPVCKNFSPASHSGGETTLDITTAQATARVLEEQLPQVFTVENVKRYIGSEAYNIIVNKLNELGYTWDVAVYKASDYGNATKRERMIIRAVKDGQLPEKPHKASNITSWGEATRDLWGTDLIPSTLVRSKIEAIKNTPQLKGVKLTKLDKPLLIYDTTKSKTVSFAWADELAPTLTTKCGDARIIMPDGRVYAPTPKFMGRIQGLPDDYKYPKAVTNAFKIIGNGIPTQLTKAVMGGVLDSAYEQTHDGQVLYSDRSPSSVSTRSLLANALETTAQNDIEKTKLAQYKGKIELIEAEYAKLSEIKKKANEIRFAKGRTSAETKKLKALDFEANEIANRINTYDRQLLNLEATTALKNVLQREKKLAYDKAKKEGKAALAKQKEKAAQTQRELMNRNTESRQKAIERRDKTEMRGKIKKVVGDLKTLLLDPTKDKHVPISLQKAVAEALDIINMDTVGADERVAKYNALIAKSNDPDIIAELTKSRDRIALQGESLADKLTALKSAYAEIKNSDDPLIKGSHDESIETLIHNTAITVGETSLRDMSYEQLEAVYDMYKAILTKVRNANKMFKEGKQETITANSEWTKREISAVGGHRNRVLKATKFLKKFGWNMLKPIYAMKLIGSDTLTRLYENVRKGEDTWAVDVNEAKEFFHQMKEKYEYNTWDFKKPYKFTDSAGHSFSLTLEQIMSLYAYSKRSQADKHLEIGGFIFDDAIEVTEKNKLGIPMKYEVNDANPYRLKKEDLGKIISILDTDLNNVKKFVDEMQAYLSDVMGAKGNEVSLAMYDIKLYKDQNYFPLKSAKYFREFDPEKNGTPKIKNSGFSKKTVPQAGNPIILSNFMDVWANHVNDMSMYHAFVLPLEDFMRVYNYSSTAGGYDSVQQYIKNAYGAQANTYIETLMNDLNGGARTDPATDLIGKLMSLFKKAAVFASASVVIQQPSAIARATAYIDPKYFVDKPEATKHKETWAEVKKYAPVAIIKEMGYFDTNMGRSTVDWIRDEKTLMDKIDDVASKAPALADELAWCAIWKAVKREVADSTNLKADSEEFLKMAGKRFTEVVTKTQVYDSVLSRSALMRSKDTGAKMVTAFMAEPTTSLNMVVDAIIEGKRGNKKFAGKVFGAVAASIVLNSILVSLVTAARDDDDDETYTEKYLESLTAELLDGFNPLTYIPLIKDIWSIMQGYDVERSDMSIWSDLWQSVENLFSDKKSGFEKTEGVVGSIASIFGLPLKNLMRDARAMYNLASTLLSGTPTTWAGVGEAVGGAIKSSIPLYDRIEKWVGADKSKSDNLYDAIISGDQKHIDRVKAQYKDEKAIESAIRQGLRENDSRIHEAAQARYDGDVEEYKRIAKEIIAEGYFSQDTVVAAINAEINAIKKGEATEEDQTDDTTEEATSIYKASDINSAFESGDTEMALEVIDDLFNTKVENYIAKAKKEAEEDGKRFNENTARKEAETKAKSSIRSSMTSYWKPLYKAAYKSKNTAEQERIKKILKDSGIYGNAHEVITTVQEWRTERD